METLSQKFLKIAAEMIRNPERYSERIPSSNDIPNLSNITTYMVGYEIDLLPKETDKLVSHLKAKDLISVPDPLRQESQGLDFRITPKGREYI